MIETNKQVLVVELKEKQEENENEKEEVEDFEDQEIKWTTTSRDVVDVSQI